MVFQALNGTYLICLRKRDSVYYYGDSQHPFFVFQKEGDALEYLTRNGLDRIWRVVKATGSNLNQYFSASIL
jgi:hypothetical protein